MGVEQDQVLLDCLGKDSCPAVEKQANAATLTTPRKRPIVSAAERTRKETTQIDRAYKCDGANDRLNQSLKKLPNQWDHNSEDLAAHLQEVVLDELNNEARLPHDENNIKFKPRPPKPRKPSAKFTSDRACQKLDTNNEDQIGNDSDYVYDTYVKIEPIMQAGSSRAEMLMDPLSGIDGGTIGVLVIEDEEEALWETYGDVGESDSEYNSEEDDENGQHANGNRSLKLVLETDI